MNKLKAFIAHLLFIAALLFMGAVDSIVEIIL